MRREGFGSRTRIFWSEREQIKGYERVSRAEAVKLCRAERLRRKYVAYDAYHTPAIVLPYGSKLSEADAKATLRTKDGVVYF